MGFLLFLENNQDGSSFLKQWTRPESKDSHHHSKALPWSCEAGCAKRILSYSQESFDVRQIREGARK